MRRKTLKTSTRLIIVSLLITLIFLFIKPEQNQSSDPHSDDRSIQKLPQQPTPENVEKPPSPTPAPNFFSKVSSKIFNPKVHRMTPNQDYSIKIKPEQLEKYINYSAF